MKKALVIGINDYPTAPLTGCVNDANAIANVLETHGDGAPNFEIKLITVPNQTLSIAKLKAEIVGLFSGDPDIALLYFSGHGNVNAYGGYIVTPDFQKYDEGVSMDEILKKANDSHAKDKVIVLDCCHSGAFGSFPFTASNVAMLSDGLSILTASKATEAAMEYSGRGVFTALVVDALKGGAADLRGHITPGGIYAYVDQALGAWDQRPVFKTNITRFTSLRTISPQVPFATLRKLIEHFPTAQDEHKLDPSYEYTHPSANPAHVAIFKDLQKYASVGLVVPVGEEYMYYAAIESKSCRLTALGFQYWRLVKEKRI